MPFSQPSSTHLLAVALLVPVLAVGCTGRQAPAPAAPAPAATAPFHVTQRPPVMGPNAGVSTGHPLATAAAMEILQKGGNAFDAGVAAMLACGVLEQDLYSLGGEGTA